MDMNTTTGHAFLVDYYSRVESNATIGETLNDSRNDDHDVPPNGVRLIRCGTKRRFRADLMALVITSIALLSVLCVYYLLVAKTPSLEHDDVKAEISALSYPSCGKIIRSCSGGKGPCRERRLVGGRPVLHAWPWMTEILVDGKHFCGGTLIAPNWVLTAAHCLRHHTSRMRTTSLTVRVGLVNRKHPESTSQTLNVSRIIIHEGFSKHTFAHDIGLLELSRPAKLDRYTWPSCLPSVNSLVEGKASLTGWGRTKKEQEFSTLLHEVDLPIVSTETCALKNKNLFPSLQVDLEKQVCAGGGKSEPGYGCDGDSGGPLNWQNGRQQWIVAGITSWGDPNCRSESDTFTVFTRVAAYETWLGNHIKHYATSQF